MEVEYEITYDDLYSFYWRAGNRSPILRRQRRWVYIYFFLSFLFFAFLPASAEVFALSRAGLLWLLVIFPAVAFIVWHLDRRKTRRAIVELIVDDNPGRGQLGPHKISLNEKEVVENTAVGESRTLWAGVERVEQNQDHIFIYTTPTFAYIIPKRAFRSVQDAKSFYQTAIVRKLRASC